MAAFSSALPPAKDDEPLEPTVASLLACINSQNTTLARIEQEKLPSVPLHCLSTRRQTSWLSSLSVANHVGRALGVASSRMRAEDDRLARIAARYMLPRGLRLGCPNGIDAVIVGCGKHGLCVAGEMLRRGCTVYLCDQAVWKAEKAHQRVCNVMDAFARNGQLMAADVPELRQRLLPMPNVEAAVAQRSGRIMLMIEAVPEALDLKQRLLCRLVAACEANAVDPSLVLFMSNTTTLSWPQIAAGVRATHGPATTPLVAAYLDRGLCARWFTPCFFVDTVEISVGNDVNDEAGTASPVCAIDEEPKLSPAVNEAVRLLQAMAMKPACLWPNPHTGEPPDRRTLTYEEAVLYEVRQKQTVEEDAMQQMSVAPADAVVHLILNFGLPAAAARRESSAGRGHVRGDAKTFQYIKYFNLRENRSIDFLYCIEPAKVKFDNELNSLRIILRARSQL